MVKGRKVSSKRDLRKRVRSKGSGSDDSDEDYVVSDDAGNVSDCPEDDCFSLDGCAAEDSFDGFIEDGDSEKEVIQRVTKFNRSRAKTGVRRQRTNVSKASRKRQRVTYVKQPEEEQDEEKGDEEEEVEEEEEEEEDDDDDYNDGDEEEEDEEEEEEKEEVEVEEVGGNDEDEDDEFKREEEDYADEEEEETRGRKKKKDNSIYEDEEFNPDEEDHTDEEEEEEARGRTKKKDNSIYEDEEFNPDEEDHTDEEEEEETRGRKKKKDNSIYEDEEFNPEEEDHTDEEEEEEGETKGRKKKNNNGTKMGKKKALKKRVSATSSRGRKRSGSRVSKKPKRKRRRKNGGSRRKVQCDDADDLLDNVPAIRTNSRKRSVLRRRRVILEDANSGSDCESRPSDYEFTISEEEKEQVREAVELCGNIRRNLRRASLRMENEVVGVYEDLHQQWKPLARKGKEKIEETQGRKGKEKVEDLKSEVGKQVCGICLSEENKRRVRGVLNSCTHYFCFACIMEWSKVESRCPLCKQRFQTISKPARSTTAEEAVIQVPERDQVFEFYFS